MSRALADTSVFIGLEQARIHALAEYELAVSTVTIGELKLGVLAAADSHTRAQRLRTLEQATALEPLPVDGAVADAWSELRIALREHGRKLAANDAWIAATAIARGLPLVTQDAGYQDVPGLRTVMA